MKRKICLTLFVLLGFLPLMASQETDSTKRGFGDPKYELTVLGGYSYNVTWGHHGNLDVKALMPINPYFEAQANIQLSTANVYTGAAILRPKFALPVGELFLETELLYKAYVRNNQWDFNAALSLGYRMDYVSVQLGVFSRLMSTFDYDWHSTDAINCEPFSALYRVEVFCRPQRCNWNISACISNIDDYQMEREWQPLFMLGGRYDVNDHWRVMLQAQCKPTGMFHLDATFYGATVRTGFTYKF